MTLGSTPTPAQILAELSQTFPYTFPDARTRWLADVGASGSIIFPTSFASKMSVKVVASVADAGGSSPHTFSGLTLGDAFPDRVLVACTCLVGSAGTAIDITNVTINGVTGAGRDKGHFLSGGPAIGTGVFASASSSGTSGSVVLTWTGQNANAAGIILLSMAATTATEFDHSVNVPSAGGKTTFADTVNISSNGVLILNTAHTNSNDATLTGVAGRSALTVGTARMNVGFDNRMTLETARSVSASWTGTAAVGFQAFSFTQS